MRVNLPSHLGVFELDVFALWFSLVCWLWLSSVFLLGREFFIWLSAITVIRLQFDY
jgi:hypothetical protein